MRVVAVVSPESGSGKTTTVVHLVRELRRRGIRVATIKHIPKRFSIDTPGKDTWKHAEAGAEAVVALSLEEAAFILRDSLSLEDAVERLSRLGEYEVVVVEGFRGARYPKLVAAKRWEDAEALVDELTIAVTGVAASEEHPAEPPVPVVNPLEEPGRLAELVLGEEAERKQVLSKLPGLDCGDCGSESCAHMAERIVRGERSIQDCVVLSAGREVSLKISGREVPMGSFVQGFVRNVVLGMVRSLKKAEAHEGDVIEIRVRL